MSSSTPAVRTCALTRRFGARPVLDAVSMTVPAGSVYGFLGANGAGKTTTLNILLGLLRPTRGSAQLFGLDIRTDRIAAMRKVGALLEAHGFYANLSGHENLDLTRSLLGLPRSEPDRVLDAVDLRAHARRSVSEYSLGMRQRLGIARAMLGSPALLVLDEPTNGLDPNGIADMRQFLRALPERTGATVLISSHLLSEIELIATHVGILHKGRLAAEGELQALKAKLAPEIGIETDNNHRAAALLSSHGFKVADAPEGLIVVLPRNANARAAAAAMGRALHEAQIGMYSLTHRAMSLESLYHDLQQAAA